MTRRTVGLVATPVLALIVAVGSYFAGTSTSAHASEMLQDRPRPKICWHDEFSVYRCGNGDSTKADFAPALASRDIQDISVTIRPKVGRPITFYLPATTDAIFLQRPAIENMLLRYYYGSRQRTRGDSLRAVIQSWPR